jgi:YihY family inner membrane protein
VGDRGDPAPPPPTRSGGMGARFAAAVDRLDRYQQRQRVTAVPGAVIRKYSDDRGGRLASQISHSAFLAVFPLLLVLLTVVDIVLDGHKEWQDDVVDSALRQFPVVGADLGRNVHQLSTANTLALVVGLVWMLYGSMKLSRSAQVMMATVWDIDRADLPGLGRWVPRALGFLAVLGAGFIAGGAVAGLGAFGSLGPASAGVGLALSLAVSVAMYWGAFTVLVRLPRTRHSVWPGAVVGGVGWTVLQFVGVELVSHQLRHLSNLYGTFATVLGLIWWLALGAMVTVLAAECNVVLSRRLWPRSLRRPKSGSADGSPGGGDGDAGTPATPQPVAPSITADRGEAVATRPPG